MKKKKTRYSNPFYHSSRLDIRIKAITAYVHTFNYNIYSRSYLFESLRELYNILFESYRIISIVITICDIYNRKCISQTFKRKIFLHFRIYECINVFGC